MDKAGEFLKSKIKLEERNNSFGKREKRIKKFVDEIVSCFEAASLGNRDHLIESLEYALQEKPEFIEPQLDFVIYQLGSKVPRVKWECP